MLRIFSIHASAWNASPPNLGHETALPGIMLAKATLRGSLVSVEENKAVIRRLFDQVYNDQNLDVLDKLVAEDVVNHAAADEHKHGIEGFRHVIEWTYALAPDARSELIDMIAEGDKVACRVRVSGTQEGEIFGIPPTGKSFAAEHVHWHRVVGGKLVERWAVRDDLGMLIQLGIIDPPGRFKADEPD